jgi:hypothetical protein
VVAYPGHDVAQVAYVVPGERVEQKQPGQLDVARQDAAEEGRALVGEGHQGGAFVVREGAPGDQAGLLQQAGLIREAATAVDDAVGQLRHGQRPVGVREAGQ